MVAVRFEIGRPSCWVRPCALLPSLPCDGLAGRAVRLPSSGSLARPASCTLSRTGALARQTQGTLSVAAVMWSQFWRKACLPHVPRVALLLAMLASLARLAPHPIADPQCPDRESFPFRCSSLPSIRPPGPWALGHLGYLCLLRLCLSLRPGNLEHGPRKHTIICVADQVLCSRWCCLDVSGNT